MTIHLQPLIEEELKRVARERGRDLQSVVDEAIQQYLVGSSITDMASEQVGQTQDVLIRGRHNRTPRLAHPEQAGDFRKQIIECECAKLDPAFEQELADEGLSHDLHSWPEY